MAYPYTLLTLRIGGYTESFTVSFNQGIPFSLMIYICYKYIDILLIKHILKFKLTNSDKLSCLFI